MKTFKRSHLQQEIKYNGITYTPNHEASAKMNMESASPKKVIEELKTKGTKAVLVEVLSRNLKIRTDLRGNPYKPSKFIYTA